MFRRYHHGHSAGLGFLLALSLYGHALVYTLLVFVAGLIAGRAWATWTLWASALRGKWHLAKHAPGDVARIPGRRVSAQDSDGIPF